MRITAKSSIYANGLMMLLAKASWEMFHVTVTMEHAIGDNLYCTAALDAEQIAQVKARMQELIAADLPIRTQPHTTREAAKLLRSEGGCEARDRMLRYRRSAYVTVCEIDGYYDYYYGGMLASTGAFQVFDLIPYEDGVMLVLPDPEAPDRCAEVIRFPKLFRALREADDLFSKIDVNSVGALNDAICNGAIGDIMLLQEALQERKIAEIAGAIAARPEAKFVMIAGPSSSGKTSFSHRLSIQLQSYGLKTYPIELDTYYKDHKDTPRDEDGNPDYECLEALDVAQFNEDMRRLLAGEEVELPSYDFKAGKREYRGKRLRLEEGQVLLIEGIHGLNPKMSEEIAAENKFKIYISAMTTMNIDEHNRIATSDVRLLRRLVRDSRTRGMSAAATLEIWPSVRRGEKLYIFPFQEEADAIFNSTLLYELPALKLYAEPQLYNIPAEDPQYAMAQDLLKFLGYFLGITAEQLPNNSLGREFLGGSIFPV